MRFFEQKEMHREILKLAPRLQAKIRATGNGYFCHRGKRVEKGEIITTDFDIAEGLCAMGRAEFVK